MLSHTKDILPVNGQTISSSNPEDDGKQIPSDVICYDPQDREKPCPICDGKGMVMLNVPVTDARYGKIVRCPNYPVEVDLDRQERLRKVGNLGAYKDKTFESFITNPFNGRYTESAVASLQMALQRAEDFVRRPHGWIVYEGTYGSGKTHLAVAIGNARLEQFGDQVLFITAPDLLDYLRTSFSPTAEASYDETFERIRNIQLLILDDLGVENPSGWAKEKLFQLLNYRYVKALPTVITTNTPLEELDPRVGSRMMQGDVVKHVKITAPDYRAMTRPDDEDRIFNKFHHYHAMTFSTFDTRSKFPNEQENLTRALETGYNYALKPQGWLYIMGAFGSGKTHLAAAIANQLHEQGKPVLFTTVPDLLDYLRITFDPKSNVSFDKRFYEIVNAPYLFLDDLRMASATIWSREKLFQILDHRYLTKMPTVITSAESVEDTTDRLATRLTDRRICYPFAMQVNSYVKRTTGKTST